MDEQKNNAPAENKPEKKLSRTTLTIFISSVCFPSPSRSYSSAMSRRRVRTGRSKTSALS